MNKKRGFTLVELVVVIGLLGILMLITVPMITNLQANSNRVLRDAKIKTLETVGEKYGNAAINNFQICNSDLTAAELKNACSVSLSDLVKKGYIDGDDDGDNIIDPETNKPLAGRILFCYDAENISIKASYVDTDSGYTCNIPYSGEKTMTIAYGLKANIPTIVNYGEGETTEMYTFSHPSTDQTETLVDYRYIGSTPHNYVMFNDEMWRIIGVFPTEMANGQKKELIKIIRDADIGSKPWGYIGFFENYNWEKTSLHYVLNTHYYNQGIDYSESDAISGLNPYARTQVANAKWYLGELSTLEGGGANYYAFERGKTVQVGNPISTIQKIGLMYPSDFVYTFAYGVNNACFTNRANCSPSTSWMHDEIEQWTQSTGLGSVIRLAYGSIGYSPHFDYTNVKVKPVLYLSPDIKITSGNGSSSNPYILNEPKCKEIIGEEKTEMMQASYRITYPNSNSYTFNSETGKFTLASPATRYWFDLQGGYFVEMSSSTSEIDTIYEVVETKREIGETGENYVKYREITASCK